MEVVSDSPRRRSIRLKEYDYAAPGAYFVTVVTHHRAHLFGAVVDGEMKLNRYGVIARDEWFRTENLRPYVRLHPEAMVVMPNHIHGIIWIDEIEADNRRGAASLRPYTSRVKHFTNVASKSLGAIIRAYKSSVTYRINTLRNSPGSAIWQRNYYEHIVRNQIDLDDIYTYITSNPIHWLDDPEYVQS